ncbi:ribose-5-phosphate isomerase RpiA [Methylobacterium sp. ID0610]|uniref:ribose-5-phosphate isomerase RpiA n=1 Tax=Methylobacterium carpenticola TaxID=3344827 RepID=UPI0036CF5FE8
MSADLKRAAAARAVDLVQDGMRLGLGTGSTAAHFVDLLGARVRDGLSVVGVPTSEATHRAAQTAGIPLTTLDETPELDLTVDGADEIDGSLRLIKGGGGALLREKIVAAASRRMVVIADGGKQVDTLGRFPLPIEVVPFGLGATRRAIAGVLACTGCAGDLTLRTKPDGAPFHTDGAHLILDAHLGRIPDPEALAAALAAVPGIVEHGLFLGLCTGAVLAAEEAGAVRLITLGAV